MGEGVSGKKGGRGCLRGVRGVTCECSWDEQFEGEMKVETEVGAKRKTRTSLCGGSR